MELTHSAGKECVSVCFPPGPAVYRIRAITRTVLRQLLFTCPGEHAALLTRFHTDRAGKVKKRASAVAAMQHPMELCLIKSRETFQSLQSDLNGTITTHSHAPQEQVKHTTSLRMFALSEPSHGASSSTPRPQRTVTVLDPLCSVHVILCILSSPRLPASRPAAGGLRLS